MNENITTSDDGQGNYRDPRLPNVELRWEGETFDLWVFNHPAAPDFSQDQGVRGQEFRIFSAEEAPLVNTQLAHAVAQCLFDALSRDNPAWAEHLRRFGEHSGCIIETTCAQCACCSTASTPGCACKHCRCGLPGNETGHPYVPLEQAVLQAAKRLLDAGAGT